MDLDKIIVHKLNEATIKIECEPSIAREIQDNFTFYANNYRFNPKYKNGVWDGKIRLLNLKNYTLYSGLLEKLESFAISHEYPFETSFNNYGNELSLIEAINFINNINPNLPEGEATRDYQIKSFVDGIRNKKCILLSPTGSGKSLIIYLLSRYMLDRNKKILIVVPTINLVEQLYTDFIEYSINNKWNVEEYCHRVYQGKEKDPINKQIIISTWQSIYNLPEEYFSQFTAVIGDEADGFKANSLIEIMTKLVNAEYRIGTTGTLDDVMVNELVLEGLFGKIIKIISTKELMDKKYLSQLEIKCLTLKHNNPKKMDYETESKYLISSSSRNKFIKNLALSLDGNTLILFRYLDHGKFLYDNLKDNGKNCYYISGKTEIEIRENIRKVLEKETNAILIASYGTFSRGSNVRN
ncbi:MAG: DEAD/DEAH box helicase family protein, partial [Candidatus Paceibacterota bacterium]